MKPDVLQQLFFEARASWLFVRRVGSIVFLALILFHLGFFSQYLSTLGAKVRLDAEQARVQGAITATARASFGLRQLSESVKGLVGTSTKACLEGLKKDFMRFDQMVLATLMDSGVRGRFDSRESVNIQQRQAPAEFGDRVPLPALPEDIVRMLRSEVDGVKLRRILSPYVVQHIIERNFLKLNGDLNQELGVLFNRELPGLRQILREASRSLSIETTAFTELDRTLAELEHFQFKVEIPQGDWWKTVETKVAMLDVLGESAFESVHQHLGAAGLERAAAAAIQVATELEGLSKQLNAAHGVLEQNFEDYKKQLAKWASLFGVVAIELRQLVLCFPLLLSAASVAFLASLGVCRRRLASIVDLAHQKGVFDEGLAHVLKPRNGLILYPGVLLGTGAWVVVASVQLLLTPSVEWYFSLAEMVGSLLLLGGAGCLFFLGRGRLVM